MNGDAAAFGNDFICGVVLLGYVFVCKFVNDEILLCYAPFFLNTLFYTIWTATTITHFFLNTLFLCFIFFLIHKGKFAYERSLQKCRTKSIWRLTKLQKWLVHLLQKLYFSTLNFNSLHFTHTDVLSFWLLNSKYFYLELLHTFWARNFLSFFFKNVLHPLLLLAKNSLSYLPRNDCFFLHFCYLTQQIAFFFCYMTFGYFCFFLFCLLM